MYHNLLGTKRQMWDKKGKLSVIQMSEKSFIYHLRWRGTRSCHNSIEFVVRIRSFNSYLMRGLLESSRLKILGGGKKKRTRTTIDRPPPELVRDSFSFQNQYHNSLGKRCQLDSTGLGYPKGLENIAVTADIMGTSKIQKAMRALQEAQSSSSVPTINELTASVLNFAFGKNSWNRRVSVPEMDFSSHNLYGDMVGLTGMFTHQEADFLRISLFVLLNANDQRLRAFCGLLGRSYHECSARRRMALTTIILAAYEILQESTPTNATSEAVTESDQLAKAKRRVFDHCVNCIEDLKEAAFRSVFLEPCELYFDLIGDSTASGDVDVHGSNTFAALLEATTHIRLPRYALLDDGFAGIADVSVIQSDSFQHAVHLLRQPENVGKRYRSVLHQDLRKGLIKLNRAASYRGHRTFIFNEDSSSMHATCVADLVRAATTPYLSSPESRERFTSYYLSSFAAYFSAEQILPRLFNSCHQDTSGISEDLQTIFLALKADPTIASSSSAMIPPDTEHYREWLWDIESLPPVFRIDAARMLFGLCGVVTAASSAASSAGAASEQGVEPNDSDNDNDHDNDITAKAMAHGVFFDYEPTTHPLADRLGPRVPPHCLQLSAAGDVRGGGTGREYLYNLHGVTYQPGDKWLDPVGCEGRQSSWVIATTTEQPLHLSGYALCSANDVPDRDPIHWRLYVKICWGLMGMEQTATSEEEEWVQLHEVNLAEMSTVGDSFIPADPSLLSPMWPRWQWIAYQIPSLAEEWGVKEIPISAIKLDIVRLRGSPRIQETQLAHWHLFGRLLNRETLEFMDSHL